uniref:P-type ATPase A domain-containing protein n=1 Tax=Leersia perrieri TaxID=77586 RepID=A0A0D9V8V9_9ORYZ
MAIDNQPLLPSAVSSASSSAPAKGGVEHDDGGALSRQDIFEPPVGDSNSPRRVAPPNPPEAAKGGGKSIREESAPSSSATTSAPPGTSSSAPTAVSSESASVPAPNDEASASMPLPPPHIDGADQHSIALARLGDGSLLDSVKVLCGFVSDSSLAAPAEHLATALLEFVDSILENTNPIRPRWRLARAAVALAEAAEPNKELEVGREAVQVSRRALKLLSPNTSASMPNSDASLLALLLMSTTPETPKPHRLVLACLGQETLLADVKRFLRSLTKDSNLREATEKLHIALFAFLDTIVNKQSIVGSQWQLARAVLALADAADDTKSVVEAAAAREAAQLSLRAMRVIHKEIDHIAGRSYRGFQVESLAVEQVEEKRTLHGGEAVEQEHLKDKWSIFFSVLPMSLGLLPLILPYLQEKYKAPFGYIYGLLILVSLAGLLINLNAVDRCDVKMGNITGNLSVLTLAVLVSLYIWSSLDPGMLPWPGQEIRGLMILPAKKSDDRIAGAIALKDYSEAGFSVFLFTTAEWLVTMASHKATAGMSALMSMAPQNAILAESGQVVVAQDVKVNTVIAVKAGEVIPIDGVVVDGRSEVDESTLTGESFPVSKQPDSQVWAGTLNIDGYIAVRTTAMADNSAVAKMARLVEEAQNSRSNTQRLIDTFAKYFTPAVVVMAGSVAAVPAIMKVNNLKYWLQMALVLLVRSCPCALVLSTSIATFCALLRAARGEFSVKEFQVAGERVSMQQLLYWVSSIESRSSHPMASVLVDYAQSKSVESKSENAAEFQIYPGEGIYGEIGGAGIYIGNKRILSRASCETVSDMKDLRGVTIGYVACKNELIGVFTLSDACRIGSAEAIKELRSLGIKSVMLMGDSTAPATYAQNQLGNILSEVHSELLPEDKVRIVGELKERYGPTLMVGDGMNDAPALAKADVGVSMGVSGSAVATETSHITLMSNDIRRIPKAVRLAKRTHRTSS